MSMEDEDVSYKTDLLPGDIPPTKAMMVLHLECYSSFPLEEYNRLLQTRL